MKSSSVVTVAVALFVSVVNALILEQRDSPAVFRLPLQKRTDEVHAMALRNRLMRRSGDIVTTDTNYMNSLLYVVQLSIGTPPQTVMVQLDTGSSDLVVETDSSDICSAAPPNPCTNLGACKKSLLSSDF
jgi:hypothetical protein